LVIGFEAFPARVQPALDRWVSGGLDEAAFLAEADWRRVWGVDPDLYLPLFHLARLHRLPMVALNAERGLVARVGREGWAAVPAGEREGLGDPAPAAPAYRERLRRTFDRHRPTGSAAASDGSAFDRFVDAQLTWDRAMAEALVRARDRPDQPLVVGIIGSEHLRQRHGVPHQLEALGVADPAVLLPHDLAEGCAAALTAGDADAVFVLDPPPPAEPEPARPRLGVRLAVSAGEVQAVGIAPGGVAEASGLRQGDVILEAGGQAIGSQADLVGIVRGTPPGTWLPLLVRRDGRTLEAVAKFPRAPEVGP
jgi:hypothetical protein